MIYANVKKSYQYSKFSANLIVLVEATTILNNIKLQNSKKSVMYPTGTHWPLLHIIWLRYTSLQALFLVLVENYSFQK